MTYYFFKDVFVPADQVVISVEDRSFRFGDGVFDTMLVTKGKIYDFPAHHQRLKNGLEYCRIDFDTENVLPVCEKLIQKNNLQQGHLRIIISRGENGPGALGYLPKNPQPYMIIQSMEKVFPSFQTMQLYVATQPAYESVPCKSNNSLRYTLAMIEAEEQGCDNALILDAEGHICETASGNIFWYKDKTLYTPAADLPFVPGTMRNKLLQLWSGEVKEVHATLQDLTEAEELFMTNTGCLAAGISAVEPAGIYSKNTEISEKIYQLLVEDIEYACR